jgi:hypothetical protein
MLEKYCAEFLQIKFVVIFGFQNLLIKLLQAMKKIILLFALLTGVFATAQKKASVSCSQIETEKDDAKGEVIYKTPFVDGISIEKVKKEGLTMYICTVKILSDTKQKGSKASILFDNGNLISKPDAEILDGAIQNKKYEYFAMFLLNKEEIAYFKEGLVKGVMVMDTAQVAEQASTIQTLADCLINK